MTRLHKFFLWVALAAFFVAPASAQNGRVTNHAFAVGKGAGVTGYTSILCTTAQLAVGQSAADPICQTITGDWTLSAAGAATLATVNANVGAFGSATNCPTVTVNAKGLVTAASATTCAPAIGSVTGLATGVATFLATPSSANLRAALTDEVGTGAAYFVGGALGTPASGTLTNATGLPPSGLTAQAAYTLLGNSTGSSASPAAIDVTALTSKASPVSADIVLIQDSAASNAFKQTTVGALASAGSVASYNGRTGAVTATTTDVPLPNYITGLTLSTAGSSSTFGIATGFATDSTNVAMMALGSAYTKTTSSWAVGTGNGALDTGSIANSTWYHVWLIQRSDTGVVDVLVSTSATAPTMPTNYNRKRRIGSLLTDGSAHWVAFSQVGDEFLWSTTVVDVNGAANPGTAAVTRTLTVPTGVKVLAKVNVSCVSTDTGTVDTRTTISSLDQSDQAPGVATDTGGLFMVATPGTSAMPSSLIVRTNTSAQIRSRNSASTAGTSLTIGTYGWVDDRGKSG